MAIDLLTELGAGRKIYVRNKTNPRGAIFLTLYDIGNRPIQIQIPPTPHPFCISDYSTRFALDEGGLNLKVLLNKNVVKLIAQDKAEKILQDPTVRAELKAAIDSTQRTNEKTKTYRNQRDLSPSLAQAAGVNPEDGSPLVVNSSGLHANGLDPNIRVEADAEDTDSAVTPSVRVIVSQVQDKEITSKEAKLRLSQIADQLKEEDLAYINTNTSGQLREYAQHLMVKLRNLDDEDSDDEESGEDSEESESMSRPSAATETTRGNRTLDPSQVPADLLGVNAHAHGSAFSKDDARVATKVADEDDADDVDIDDEDTKSNTKRKSRR